VPTNKIRLLQIGDVHFPEARAEARAIDVKDAGFPDALAVRAAGSPFQTVVRHIQMLLERGGCDVIACMGDLSTRGDKTAYSECLQYLANATWDNPGVRFERKMVLVTPGNHDIDRNDARDADIAFKFQHINQALSHAGLQPARLDGCQHFEAIKGLAAVNILGINTSVGCGVLRGMPDRIRTTVQTLYDEALSTAGDAASLSAIADELYEILDTPLITEPTIQATLEHLSLRSPPLVVVGHHNLLPQYTPRIAPYTELLNSGLLRSRILSSQKKVIYLHGHIHDDPIEVISSPYYPSSLLAAISAPQVSAGFNILDFEFDSKGGVLGCEAICHRYKDGGVSVQRCVSIPLLSPSEAGASAEEAALVDAVNRRKLLYWAEAVGELGVSDDSLEDIAIRMMWQRRIHLDRPSSDRVRWLIRRCY
jgi:hypothetical protein